MSGNDLILGKSSLLAQSLEVNFIIGKSIRFF